jgi:hypothetical protein
VALKVCTSWHQSIASVLAAANWSTFLSPSTGLFPIRHEYLIRHFFPDITDEERDGLCQQFDTFSSEFIRHDFENAAETLSIIF